MICRSIQICFTVSQYYNTTYIVLQSSEKEKARGAFIKFESVWRRMATEQVLFTHKIAEMDLQQLVGDAEKLIIKLYEHPSITNTADEVTKPGNMHRPTMLC